MITQPMEYRIDVHPEVAELTHVSSVTLALAKESLACWLERLEGRATESQVIHALIYQAPGRSLYVRAVASMTDGSTIRLFRHPRRGWRRAGN